jgi:ribosomal protein S18 acetylase RimI-like enzyme
VNVAKAMGQLQRIVSGDVKTVRVGGELEIHLLFAIRPATAADLPQLEWFGHQRHLRPHIDEVLERRERGEAELLVAVANGFPVGRIGIDFTRRVGKAVLWSFAVIPNLQGLGIGTALIRTAEATSSGRGVTTVEIDVGKDNPRAQALYERLGYTVVGEEQGTWSYVDDDGNKVVVVDDDWVLQKTLSR